MTYDSMASLENWARLAEKPGVQATLILSKVDGAIVKCTGLVSRPPPPSLPSSPGFRNLGSNRDSVQPVPPEAVEDKVSYGGEGETGEKSAEEVAKTIFSFAAAAGALVGDLDQGNDVQLLRLRTRKNEIVIVPDSKYLMVVIQDAPKAA